MNVDISRTIEILERTPDVLHRLLSGLPDDWVLHNEGGESWSPYDVLGHLIHGERTDWLPRMRMILDYGEERTFARFDRFAQFEESKGKSLEDLLTEFAELRRSSLEALNDLKLTPADLQRHGQHPAFGRVTLGELLATWGVHDLSHIAQITRVMCKQYGDAVGPWKEYLPILGR